MPREAFYIRSKGPGTILDQLLEPSSELTKFGNKQSNLQLNKNANAKRMLFLSNNLDSVRQYSFTAEFYFNTPFSNLNVDRLGGFNDSGIPKLSLAVKSIDLPEYSARVQHVAMMGFSGQTINYHVDKKFKIKVEELVQDTLLHKLRSVGLLHQLGDSETQVNTETDIIITRTPEYIPSKPILKPANTGPYGPNPGFEVVGQTPAQLNWVNNESTVEETRKAPHYYFDLRLTKYTNQGSLHSVLDFIDCKFTGFRQSSFDYGKTNVMSELDFDIIFDELISIPNNEKYLVKSPKEVQKSLSN